MRNTKFQKTSHILVTGGLGFIGSHVCRELLHRGNRLTIIDHAPTLNQALWGHAIDSGNMQWIQASLLDIPDLDTLLNDVDGVIHLAAQTSPAFSVEQPLHSLQQNVASFLLVLEALRNQQVHQGNVIPLVFASSAAVYGDQNGNPCTESIAHMVPRPMSPYGLEKLTMEHYADLYTRLHGCCIVALRLFNVYGPGQPPESAYSGVISKFIRAVQTGSGVDIFGDGLQRRDFIHVQNVAQTLIRGLDLKQSGVFNIATGNSVTLLDVCAMLEKLSGKPLAKRWHTKRLGDIAVSVANIQRARKAGLLPETLEPFQNGLASLLF
jgi:UDP-glucose 4-epimerase